MNSLWQISNDLLAIENELAETGGELTPELEQALEITQKELQSKCFNYVKFIEKLEADIYMAETYKAKAADFAAKKARTIKRLKAALKIAVINFGTIETDIYKISNRRSEAVEIVDETKIPDAYKTIKQDIVINKMAIKADLKAGHGVPGAELKENQNLQIK